ncbi:MAG: hypothetical protein P4L53_16395 [Candidatus Obscuribacterales bacterium]|nr:hypothetical protein [Candidatus Obscuribacterales bacterium]
MPESHPSFQAEKTLYKLWLERAWFFILEQRTLFEAFWVAVSIHIIMFPVMWFIGWALPWPKPPVVTTVIEYDLQAWLKNGKPKRVFEYRDPALNQ